MFRNISLKQTQNISLKQTQKVKVKYQSLKGKG